MSVGGVISGIAEYVGCTLQANSTVIVGLG